MTDTITFFIPGIPRPGGSKKAFMHPHTKRIIVTDDAKGNREWKQSVALFASQAYAGEPLTGPLHVEVTFQMPRIKGHFGSGKNAGALKQTAPIGHTVKPDATKLMRSTEDALTGIIWKDDACIVRQVVMKIYDSRPGALVSVTRMNVPDAGAA